MWFNVKPAMPYYGDQAYRDGVIAAIKNALGEDVQIVTGRFANWGILYVETDDIKAMEAIAIIGFVSPAPNMADELIDKPNLFPIELSNVTTPVDMIAKIKRILDGKGSYERPKLWNYFKDGLDP